MCVVFLTASSYGGLTEEEFEETLARSLAISRKLFPQAADPDSALAKAVLARIEWTKRNHLEFFADPNWPLKITAIEAAALGISPHDPAPRGSPARGRFLAVATRNFSETGASFRKGQQVLIESIKDYGKRGNVLVDGKPLLLWLDNFQIVRELKPGETAPSLIKIESARYGFPGSRGFSVSSTVQSVATPAASGTFEVLVSDALLTPAAAQRLKRATSLTPPQSLTGLPQKILTVVYSLNGSKKVRQGLEGYILVLD